MYPASDSIATITSDPAGSSQIRQMHRELILRGLGPDEAANLVARLHGLRVGETPWTISQISRLLFLRHLYRSDRMAAATLAVHATN